MGKKISFAFLSVLVSIVLASSAFAAGFALYEASARGNALGGAMVGRADDPSALYFNPAGITQLPGTQVLLGATMLGPKMDMTTTGTLIPPSATVNKTSLEENYFLPPHAYLTYGINDRWSIGLGIFSRFGLGVEWPQSWPGRFNSYNSSVVTSEANPNVAYKVTDNFSLSAGVSMMYFKVKLQQKIPGATLPAPLTAANEIDQKLSGDSYGYGFNFGVHYKPSDVVSLGVAYRSQVKQDVSGTLEYNGQTPIQTAGGFPAFTNGSVTITLPDQWFMGVTIRPFKPMSVEVGGIFTRWSTYNELRLETEAPVAIAPTKVFVKPKNWKDAWRFHVGAEFNVTDWLDLRLSYIFDQTPVPDETIGYELPDSNRMVFGVGLGFHANNWTVDLSYNYLTMAKRDIAARPADGVLASSLNDAMCNIVGLSVGYKF